jgi:hypothetical protein
VGDITTRATLLAAQRGVRLPMAQNPSMCIGRRRRRISDLSLPFPVPSSKCPIFPIFPADGGRQALGGCLHIPSFNKRCEQLKALMASNNVVCIPLSIAFPLCPCIRTWP